LLQRRERWQWRGGERERERLVEFRRLKKNPRRTMAPAMLALFLLFWLLSWIFFFFVLCFFLKTFLIYFFFFNLSAKQAFCFLDFLAM
jgi:cell division septal protein FtsQ